MDPHFIKSEKYESFTINVQIYDDGDIALVTMLKMTGHEIHYGSKDDLEMMMIRMMKIWGGVAVTSVW